MPSMMKAPHSKGMNCPMCAGGACKYADGGEVKGVHAASHNDEGVSVAGQEIRSGENRHVKGIHRQKLAELKDMPRPTPGKSGFAEGGEVEGHTEDYDGDGDMELSHGLGKELLSALDSKDHKAVMNALEACVLHCMNKEDDDV